MTFHLVFKASNNKLKPNWSGKWTLEYTLRWRETETVFGKNVFEMYFGFTLGKVAPDIMKLEGFKTHTAAHRQKVPWFHLWGALVSSIFIYSQRLSYFPVFLTLSGKRRWLLLVGSRWSDVNVLLSVSQWSSSVWPPSYSRWASTLMRSEDSHTSSQTTQWWAPPTYSLSCPYSSP